LLALSHFENPDIVSEFEWVDLAQVCKRVVDSRQSQAAVKSITLEMQSPATQCRIKGSEPLLESLLSNLVDNAILHCPRASRVRVGCFREGSELLLAVDDSGPGLDAAQREKAPGRFYRAADTNTDGAGLVTDLLQNLDFQPAGRRILLMGAGGAARGAITPLLETKPAKLVIANRTVDRAAALAAEFAQAGPVEACCYDALDDRFDLVVNATSASLAQQVPPLPAATIGTDSLCYDMYYAAGPTAFLRWAAENGCTRLADGTGMLVEQAAETFRLWRGNRPDTAPVLDEIRRLLR